MMIYSPAASDPYAAAAALDRSLRSSSSDPADPSSGSVALDSGPDVVVTLSKGAQSPFTYDAPGKLSSTINPDGNGNIDAGASDSSAQASESDGSAVTSASPATSANSQAAAANVREDATATA